MSAWRPAAGRQTGRGDGGAGGDLALALGLALVPAPLRDYHPRPDVLP